MFKLIVNGKNGREESDFATQELAQAHFEAVRLTGHWGHEEYTIDHPQVTVDYPAVTVEHPEVPAVYEVVTHPAEPAVLDENGVEITPAREEWNEDVLVSEAVPARTDIVSEAWTAVISEAWTETIPAQYTYEIVEFTPPLADISPRQIALALLSMGITEAQVLAAINQLPSPQKEQGIIAWNRSNYFVRTEPAVAMIGALMNLSNEQLDQIWTLGVTL